MLHYQKYISWAHIGTCLTWDYKRAPSLVIKVWTLFCVFLFLLKFEVLFSWMVEIHIHFEAVRSFAPRLWKPLCCKGRSSCVTLNFFKSRSTVGLRIMQTSNPVLGWPCHGWVTFTSTSHFTYLNLRLLISKMKGTVALCHGVVTVFGLMGILLSALGLVPLSAYRVLAAMTNFRKHDILSCRQWGKVGILKRELVYGFWGCISLTLGSQILLYWDLFDDQLHF